jgi:putative sigma-54 modulation protein
MQITVRAHHVDITEALKDYAQTKLGKLDKFCSTLISIDVNLKFEKTSAEDGQQCVEVKLNLPGQVLHASAQTHDMYASIDDAHDKCEKQLTKYKEKHQQHGSAHESRSSSSTSVPAQESLFMPKPMTPEDAAIALGKRPFLMFRNSETMEINVIYHTGEGSKLGLVEPH